LAARSFRPVGRKVVQQTVAISANSTAAVAPEPELARAITVDRDQSDLLIADEVDELPVRLKRIRLERNRTFGDV
jgi:hypothetical protein